MTCLLSSGVGDKVAVDAAGDGVSTLRARDGAAALAAAALAHCSMEPPWVPATVARPLPLRRPPKPKPAGEANPVSAMKVMKQLKALKSMVISHLRAACRCPHVFALHEKLSMADPRLTLSQSGHEHPV